MSQIQEIESQRTCKIADHYQKKTLLICSYEKCEQNTRWACVDCLRKNLHQHNSLDQGYLKDQMEFVQCLEKKQKQIQDHDEQACKYIQVISQSLKGLLSEINELIKFLHTLEQTKNNNNNVLQIQQMINNVNQDFFQVSDESANQIIQIKNNHFEINKYSQFDQFLIDFNHKLKQFKSNINQSISLVRDSQLKENFQYNNHQVMIENKQQNQQKQILLRSPIQVMKIQNQSIQFQNTHEELQPQTKNNEITKQLNQQLIKQVANNPLTKSQIQSVQQYDPFSQLPQPLAQSQVQQRSSAQNINTNKLQMDQVQGNQMKPLNISNQIQRRDISQAKFNSVSNNSLIQKQVNYMNQQFQRSNK